MAVRCPGTYILLMHLAEAQTLAIGRLGAFGLPAGWYVYVGSALGGLQQRVGRHVRGSAVRRWHVDYLRGAAALRAVYVVHGDARLECLLAGQALALPGASVPVPKFGASDCRCRAHLARFPERPELSGMSPTLVAWPVGDKDQAPARPALKRSA